ncbi:alpha/beta hydrolase [Nonomuraea antri]|uniref:alpha/beta hydrolase n=1 Tax=Nonomuraea antri TaxID=2730852 RepID=UPI002E2DE602|nr:alpha/beta hydrolase [Nonomuraea antri]
MTPLLAGLLSTGVTTPADRRSGLETFYQQRLDWTACGSGYQCAKLTVPLNYRKPRGAKIRIGVIKLPATGVKSGSVVLNFGGPGGSGVTALALNKNVVSAKLRERFDIVSFDPRGVGVSAPVRCYTPSELDTYHAMDLTPDTPAERKKVAQAQKRFDQACRARSGRLLAHVGTPDAARDLDVMRAALGDRKLTYLGFSYGTYLGAFYAEMFPKNVRALVLDAAQDPSLPPAKASESQGGGFELAYRSFLRDCFKRAGCPFRKRTYRAALKETEALFARADRAPLRNNVDARQVNEAVVRWGVISALYSEQSWPLLRKALAEARRGDGDTFLRLADIYHERLPDGSYTNMQEAYRAITCADRGGAACATWPVRAKVEPRALRAKGAPPILVVGTLRDPATPYREARALAAQLSSGVLLTYDGDGHTAYRKGSACVDRVIDRYLISATAPRRDVRCPKI